MFLKDLFSKTNIGKFFALILAVLFLASVPLVNAQNLTPTVTFLDPMKIPKWTNQLDSSFPVFTPTNITDSQGNVIRQDFTASATQFYQQVLPTVDSTGKPTGYGLSKVWGFAGQAQDSVTGANLGIIQSTPGPAFEVTRGIAAQVKWVNNLTDNQGNPLSYMYPVDPTIHWANPNSINMDMTMEQTMNGLAPPFPPGYNGSPYTVPGTQKVTNPEGWNAQSPAPISIHLHGGQVQSQYDGGATQWFTPNGVHGETYATAVATEANSAVYYYPNQQEPTELWYHDHALGLTRLSVYSGLLGTYIIHDPKDNVSSLLPSGQYEIPLTIQDRTFLSDGSMYYPSDGYYPDYAPPPYNYTKDNPYALIAFVGNTIMVNGKVWPNMNVNQAAYRFRILDGSNSRFYNLSLSNDMPFTLIGTDGGYIKSPANITSKLFSVGERIDIVVDFSNLAPGTKVILKNNALWNTSSPKYPNQIETIGQVMQFTVTDNKGAGPQSLPSKLNPTLEGNYPNLPAPIKTRTLTITEDITTLGPAMPMKMYLDGQEWTAPISETPELGSTEDWVIVNTFDSHNIHLHLVQFQLVSRQSYNVTAYWKDWTALNGEPPLNHTTINVKSLEPYLIGKPTLPTASEQGWQDTIIVYSRQITTIRVRFTSQDGSAYPFDATAGPGYVWHCHILEHEDMSMMRPYIVTQSPINAVSLVVTLGVTATISVAVILVGYRLFRNRAKAQTQQGNENK
jgi:spore coat protein A, manganese oxidase